MAYWQDSVDEELKSLSRLADGFTNKRVLEIGCGNGRITRKYAHQAASIDAIDPDAAKIEKAIALTSEEMTHVHYHPLAIEDFQATEPYDLVILAWSL